MGDFSSDSSHLPIQLAFTLQKTRDSPIEETGFHLILLGESRHTWRECDETGDFWGNKS